MPNHNPFSPESTQKHIDALSQLPTEHGQIGVVADGKNIALEGSVSKDIGKPGGFFVAAQGTLSRTTKRVAGMIGWTGKQK